MIIRVVSRRRMLTAMIGGVASRYLFPFSASAQQNVFITVDLPADRGRAGLLSLKDGSGKVIAGPWRVLGKADGRTAIKKNNSMRSPVLPYGDTPTGGYRVTGAFKVGDGTSYAKKSYGIHGALRLDPTMGEARVAKDLGGRTGLLIHSGDLGQQGRLRPTNGCLRLSNTDMKMLLDELVLVAVFQGTISASCSVTTITAQVTDPLAAPDEDYDEGDPPPILPAPKIP